jgi:hypothetical protein
MGMQLTLNEFDSRDGPSAIMPFDGNSKSVQIIKPDVLDSPRFSVGEDDGFADQFGLRLTQLIQNF